MRGKDLMLDGPELHFEFQVTKGEDEVQVALIHDQEDTDLEVHEEERRATTVDNRSNDCLCQLPFTVAKVNTVNDSQYGQ
jgi:hypothetical protein